VLSERSAAAARNVGAAASVAVRHPTMA